MTALLLATVTTLAGSACADREPVVVEPIVATPTATPKRTKPSTPKRTVRKAASMPALATPSGRAPRTTLESMIRRVFGRHAGEAIRVANCETGGTWDPTVVNSSGHTGLFQLSPRWHTARARRLGFTWADMRKPEPNIRVAFDLFSEQGWGPWTCRSAI